MAAGAAALLLTGGVIGAVVNSTLRPPQVASAGGWVSRAVYAHVVYTAERRHPVEVRANEDHLSRWLTTRTEVPVRLVDLGPQGFQLMGGRLLPDGLGRSAQLMYQNSAGARVTVYLRKAEPGSDHKLRFEQTGDLGLFHWVEDGIGCVIVGAIPRAELEHLADEIYRQQEAAAASGTSS
jgi:anti-sigma factor RsiW